MVASPFSFLRLHSVYVSAAQLDFINVFMMRAWAGWRDSFLF